VNLRVLSACKLLMVNEDDGIHLAVQLGHIVDIIQMGPAERIRSAPLSTACERAEAPF